MLTYVREVPLEDKFNGKQINLDYYSISEPSCLIASPTGCMLFGFLYANRLYYEWRKRNNKAVSED